MAVRRPTGHVPAARLVATAEQTLTVVRPAVTPPTPIGRPGRRLIVRMESVRRGRGVSARQPSARIEPIGTDRLRIARAGAPIGRLTAVTSRAASALPTTVVPPGMTDHRRPTADHHAATAPLPIVGRDRRATVRTEIGRPGREATVRRVDGRRPTVQIAPVGIDPPRIARAGAPNGRLTAVTSRAASALPTTVVPPGMTDHRRPTADHRAATAPLPIAARHGRIGRGMTEGSPADVRPGIAPATVDPRQIAPATTAPLIHDHVRMGIVRRTTADLRARTTVPRRTVDPRAMVSGRGQSARIAVESGLPIGIGLHRVIVRRAMATDPPMVDGTTVRRPSAIVARPAPMASDLLMDAPETTGIARATASRRARAVARRSIATRNRSTGTSIARERVLVRRPSARTSAVT